MKSGKMDNIGFGFAYIKGEGGPLHPDDAVWDTSYPMTDSFYLKQLRAYIQAYGKENVTALRTYLLNEI